MNTDIFRDFADTLTEDQAYRFGKLLRIHDDNWRKFIRETFGVAENKLPGEKVRIKPFRYPPKKKGADEDGKTISKIERGDM